MPLNAQSQIVLNAMRARKASPIWCMPVTEVKARMEQAYTTGIPSPPIRHVEDMTIPAPHGDLPVRVYTPSGRKPFPLVVYFHGGGWVYNSLNTHDAPLRLLAEGASSVIVSVDYRLAPENPFPAAVEDAYTATQWAFSNAREIGADAVRLAVAGDSAGGNLAAVTCLLARDRNWNHIKSQILIYPNTDHVYGGFPSIEKYGQGYSLTKDAMIWFANHYIPWEQDINSPYVCPLRAPSLANLPEALVLTAEYDPLFDEGKAYAEKLAQDGVPVHYMNCEGMMHGFMLFWHVIDSAKDAMVVVCKYIKQTFSQ